MKKTITSTKGCLKASQTLGQVRKYGACIAISRVDIFKEIKIYSLTGVLEEVQNVLIA